MLLVKRDEIFVGNSSLEFELETSISASKENRRKQLKVPFKGKELSARWVLLTAGLKKSNLPTACFYSLEEREQKSCGLRACYLLFDLKSERRYYQVIRHTFRFPCSRGIPRDFAADQEHNCHMGTFEIKKKERSI